MKELKVDLTHVLRISDSIKERANSMFDECAPFKESPVDSDEYIWLMGISSALDYQAECIAHNLKFMQERQKDAQQKNNT